MATFVKNADPACDKTNWNAGVRSSDPAVFNPTALNVSGWVESFRAVRARHAVLTAKHGCGFLLWNSTVPLPGGRAYGYAVGRRGTFPRDVAREFVNTARGAGMGVGFYYSTGNNFYLNAVDHSVQPGPLLPGQEGVTQREYNDVVLGHVAELWTRFGNLTEIWFDHGYGAEIGGAVRKLIANYQPDAVGFNGEGVSDSPARWIGTESGLPPMGTWSTADEDGQGRANASQYLPAVCDTTLQAGTTWFYVPGTPLRPLSELVEVYHRTAGNNCLLELDFAVDRTGNIHPDQAALYRALGDWIDACYHNPSNVVASADGVASPSVTLPFGGAGGIVDRAVLSEDLAAGERVWGFSISATVNGADVVVANGTAVGALRIIRFPGGAVNATAVTFSVTARAPNAPAPVLSHLAFMGPCTPPQP